MSDLPFLKSRRVATALMAKTKSDGAVEIDESADSNEGLMTAAEDLISAVHGKDAKRVADALQAAFQMCDSDDDEFSDTDFLSQDDN